MPFFFLWMYVILACPTHCSLNFSACNKFLNDATSFIIIFTWVYCHNRLFDKLHPFY